MSRLIESIRLQDGKFSRLSFHQQRIDRVFREIYLQSSGWDLAKVVADCPKPQHGLYKCRFVYDEATTFVEFVPYTIRSVSTLKIVHDDEIEYAHKFDDRVALNNLWRMRGDCDDVLIIRNGLITDSSYANIVFRSGREWLTPASCLLPGTMRQYLIESGIIKAEKIGESDVKKFDSFKLINALLEWNNPEYPVSNIH